MGTETLSILVESCLMKLTLVKLNNPLMGTETKFVHLI